MKSDFLKIIHTEKFKCAILKSYIVKAGIRQFIIRFPNDLVHIYSPDSSGNPARFWCPNQSARTPWRTGRSGECRRVSEGQRDLQRE